MNDATADAAKISRSNVKFTKTQACYVYFAAIGFWFLIWAIIWYYLELSPYSWLIFYYGLFYFAFMIYTIVNIETIERQEKEVYKIVDVEKYSKTIAQLALGVAIFISIHRGSNVFNDLKRLVVLPIVSFIFIVLGPLTFVWTNPTAPRLYVARHYKSAIYMMGVLLLSAFMVEMIMRIYAARGNGNNALDLKCARMITPKTPTTS